MPIQSIPFEVLQEIFQYLPKASLLQCSRVNRSWNTATTQHLHETVEISRESPKKVLSYFVNQEPGTNVGTLTRKLKINSSYYGTTLDQEEFLQLLSYIPFIKAIEINSYMSHVYLEYLSNRNEGDAQYLEELVLTNKSLNTNLEIRQYFSVAYSFRNTLKSLILRCLGTSYEIGGQPGRTAVTFLTEFAKLTNLTIDNQHGNSDPNLSLFAILQSCPNLISLEYRSDHLIPQDSHQSSSSNQITTARVKLNKLQRFSLYLPNITGPQMECMLSYLLLNGFTRFILHLDDALSGVWVQEQSKESVRQLGKYLGMAKQVSEISILNYGHQREYTLGPTIPSSIDMMSGYYPLVGSAIKEGQTSFYHVRVDISELRSHKHSNNVVVKKKKDGVFLSYKLDTEDVQLRWLSREQVVPLIDVLVPTDGNDASFGLKMLTSMEIIVKDNSVENSTFVDIVHSAVANCPRLKFISVSGSYCKGFCLQFGSSANLCNWDWSGCYSCRGINLDPYYSKTMNSSDEAISTTAKDRIKYILMANAQVRTAPLKSVTDALPNTKILKFINCQFEQDDFHNYTIDISGIEHLNLLALDMDFMEHHRRYVFIKLEMSDDKEKCFKACDDNFNFFVPTTVKFMNSYNRFTSVHSSTIVIKCQKLDKIDIYMSEDVVVSTINF